MKKISCFLLYLFFHFTFTIGQNGSDSISLSNIKPLPVKNLEFPKTDSGQKIISHTAYSFVYNEKHEQSSWVAYVLTKEETNKINERTNKFLPDPAVQTFTANNNDYAKSGYDKGHLAPASDMGWSAASMSESFYFSNMSPQEPGFNRGIWKKLEELVRTWAVENDSVYIVVGPVLSDSLETIGEEKVSVPKYFYKVILDYTSPEIKAVGFIFPNKSSSMPLRSFAVTIDSVEKFTGIDFFPMLPDSQEKIIENNLCLRCWSWESNDDFKSAADSLHQHRIQTQTNNDPGYTIIPVKKIHASSVQCSATTKKGVRCKRMTKSPNGFCKQHGGN